MSALKETIESTKTLYSNLIETSNTEENKKIKEMLKNTYNKYTKCKKTQELFSNDDNYEIYDHNLFSFPLVCVFKTEIIKKVYGDTTSLFAFLLCFENDDRTEMIYPVIILTDEAYNLGDQSIVDFLICHELGHYRRKHLSTVYFEDGNRNILKEVEADLYACEVLGVEKCIKGFRAFIGFIMDNKPTVDEDELLKRLTFIARYHNINGALNGFKRIK